MIGLPRLSARRRRRVRAARRQISNDRESGEGRSARLKCRTLRRNKNESEMSEMLDRSRRERHRQERRIRQKRRRGEMDVRADRAIIVRLVRRMLSWILLGRRRFGRRHAGDGGAACELFEMEVSERKDKLQRHRCKREPSAPPPIGTNPTHWQNASTPAYDSLQRSRSRAIHLSQKSCWPSINWLDCCSNVTTRGWPTMRPVASILQANHAFCDFFHQLSSGALALCRR